MARLHLTRHLFVFFPQLEGRELVVNGNTAREIVDGLDAVAPGIGLYVCDERGRLRTHVNLFIDKQMVKDRRALTDPVGADADVHILQALSGG